MSELKKYDFNVEIKVPLKGIPGVQASELLARALIPLDSKVRSEILKINEWIDDLIRDGILNLTNADKEKLDGLIEKSQHLNAKGKGELFKILK